MLAADQRIRFVLAPNGAVQADIAENLPGQAVWVRSDWTLIETAQQRGMFDDAFNGLVRDVPDLPQQVFDGLERQALSALGLARRAGQIRVGFEKTRIWLREGSRIDPQAGKIGLVIIAHDAGADGAEKIIRLAAHGTVPVTRVFDSSALSAALGMDGLHFAAMSVGPDIIHHARKIERYGRYAKSRPLVEG